jgi:hypothetical protein
LVWSNEASTRANRCASKYGCPHHTFDSGVLVQVGVVSSQF